MSHGGPLRASLLHPSRERPSAEVAEAGEERGSCGSQNYRISGGEQQVTIRVCIRAGHLQSYLGTWGSAGGVELHTGINCWITGQKYGLGVFPSFTLLSESWYFHSCIGTRIPASGKWTLLTCS